MKYGYFDDANKEYVITNPKTPMKWINYIGTLNFGGFVDHTGGAVICKGDPALNRIVKYIPQMPASEFKGETLYIRIKENDSYKIFSPFFVPTLDQYDSYRCRVGNGYSIISTEYYGIRTEVTIFVPFEGKREIRDIKITNISERPMEIDVIPVVEYTHPIAFKQFNNADWVPQTMISKAVYEENENIVLTQHAFMNKDTQVNFFTSNLKISSFESDRKIFLGDNEYGTWKQPLSLYNDELSNYEALRGDNMGALLHHLGIVSPNETKRIITQLGQFTDYENEKDRIKEFRKEEKIDAAFKELLEFWEEYLSKFQVETPDKDMNSLLNIHNPKQCFTTKNWSRYLSLYQLGLGARGIGFRDTSQDIMGILGNKPEDAVDLMLKLFSTQRTDGSAMHQFFPLTMEATNGEAETLPERPNYYGDDHLWIIITVCAYLKETGDMSFLDKIVAYYQKDKDGIPVESGTILNHLERAIEFTKNDIGGHGLPHLGFADWNDTLNLPKGAESIFNANLFGKALLEMIELMTYLGKKEYVKKYKKYYKQMKKTVNTMCWDGEWYIRYFDHEGKSLGSKNNNEGQIYTNAQSWSVISEFATEDRANQALESVYNIMNTKNGIKLSYPGYNGYDEIKGGVSTYPPGAKENGGIFLHANPWVMIAETIVGNGDRAYQYYKQINPISKNDKIDEFEVEPYVYPQNILGDEHPQFGLGRNSWLSGTSSWTYQAGTKYILGIQARYNGLEINPCIPKAWNGFKIKKYFRNVTYNIRVENPEHISKGIKSIIVDGKEINGRIVPIFNDEKKHNIVVIMGKD